MTAATLKQIATAAAIEKNDIHMGPTSITATRAKALLRRAEANADAKGLFRPRRLGKTPTISTG
jgi:hypothetical protein